MTDNQTKPGSMVLVPRIATEEMNRFAEKCVPKTPSAQWNAMIAAAPKQPPAVGGEPDRDQFENEYRKEFATVRGYPISAEEMKSMRDGDFYGSDRAFLNGQWAGWQKNHRAHVAPLLAEIERLNHEIEKLTKAKT